MANRVCICHKTLCDGPWPNPGEAFMTAADNAPVRLLHSPAMHK